VISGAASLDLAPATDGKYCRRVSVSHLPNAPAGNARSGARDPKSVPAVRGNVLVDDVSVQLHLNNIVAVVGPSGTAGGAAIGPSTMARWTQRRTV
jgi:hypothetical protein